MHLIVVRIYIVRYGNKFTKDDYDNNNNNLNTINQLFEDLQHLPMQIRIRVYVCCQVNKRYICITWSIVIERIEILIKKRNRKYSLGVSDPSTDHVLLFIIVIINQRADYVLPSCIY